MRILIIKPSSLGDIIHGLLVAERIHSQIPTVRIDWVVRDVFAGIVETSGLVDTVIRFERSPAGFWKVCREIRRRKYDVVLDMQGLARSGIMTFVARAKVKIGRSDAREGSGLFYKVKAPPPRSPAPHHAVVILRQFQLPLGLYDLEPETLTFPDSPLPEYCPPEGAILLFPESRRPEKEWPGFSSLAASLCEQFPERKVCWMGTGGGEFSGQKPTHENFADLRGQVPLTSLPAVVKQSAVVVANDSGPMHLAAALGRPVVSLFGPTDPQQYGPYPGFRPTNIAIHASEGVLGNIPVEGVGEIVHQLIST